MVLADPPDDAAGLKLLCPLAILVWEALHSSFEVHVRIF